MEGKKNSKNLTLKLTATLCLSLMMFSCSSFAEEPDFSAYDFFAPTNSNEIEVPLEPEEVVQPIQKNDVIAKNIKLDTTQISKPVQPHTTNPLSLRSFSEEEYFSSDIDVTPPPEQPSLPKDLPEVGNTDTEEPEMHTVKFERENVDGGGVKTEKTSSEEVEKNQPRTEAPSTPEWEQPGQSRGNGAVGEPTSTGNYTEEQAEEAQTKQDEANQKADEINHLLFLLYIIFYCILNC